MTANTPADAGIDAARADWRAAEAAAKALEQDGYPTWEKIAKVHQLASEARLEKIKELQQENKELKSRIRHRVSLYSALIRDLQDEIADLETENKNI